MKRRCILLGAFLCLLIQVTLEAQAVGNTLLKSSTEIPLLNQYEADFVDSTSGIVKGLLTTDKVVKFKLGISKDDMQYIYNKAALPGYENFPMQFGDGTYTVKFYENTVGSKYKVLHSESSIVDVLNDTIVFLSSNQQVNWSETDEAIRYGKTLVKGIKTKKAKDGLSYTPPTQQQIIQTLYDDVVQHITYDYDKIETLKYDYIPDIDVVLKEQKGICFDYSVLLAAMLRSQGIPTKLIKGYSTMTDVYHAWNEIYLRDEARWIIVDTTYDAYMYKHKRKYTMEKSIKDYTMNYAY